KARLASAVARSPATRLPGPAGNQSRDTYGWRMRSEVLTLEPRHVDLRAGTVRLDPGSTKNSEGRIVYLTPELKTLLAEQLDRVHRLGRRLGRVVPYVFPNLSGRYAGHRRGDCRKAWGDGLPKGRVPRHAQARLSAYCGAELRDCRRAAVGRNEDHRPQDQERV